MVDSITSFFQLPSATAASGASARKLAPTVLDLGSDTLVRNPRTESLNRLFSRPASGGIFASLEGFLATTGYTPKGTDGPAASRAAGQAYAAALDLFATRPTSAETRLKQLLDAGGANASLPGSDTSSGPRANSAPIIVRNSALAATEGRAATLSANSLRAFDIDTGDAALKFTVQSGPVNGRLELASRPGQEITSFTQTDLNLGLVRYVHDGSETTSDKFIFSVSDGNTTLAPRTFNINVAAVDDAPELAVNLGLTLDEGATSAIRISRLSATDPDTAKQSLVYEVTAGPVNGRLELSTDPGTAITSFTQADLQAGRVRYVHDDSETTSDSFTFTVRDGTTTLAASTFDISVTPVNDTPFVSLNTGINVTEGGVAAITSAELSGTDPDEPDAELTYTLTSGPSGGHLELTTDPGVAITSFTQADLEAGLLRYVHDGGEAPTDSFSFTISNGAQTGTGSFTIDVDPVDDAPLLAVNAGASVNEGSTTVLTTAQLSAGDVDTADENLVFTVTSAPVNGRLELSTDPGVAITSFTQADIEAGRVRFVHNGSETLADSFTFSLSDGTTTLGAASFSLAVNPVNDAPILTSAGATVAEGGSTILTTAQLGATDPDTASASLTYTVTSAPTKGRLELTTNAGVAITSFTQADLEAGRVRFVHNGSETLADSFTFSLSDGNSTLSNNSFNITVTPVNDAPVLTTNTGTTAARGSTTLITSAKLSTTDVDTSSANIVYTITDATDRGRLELTTNPGVAITSFTQADIDAGRVRYVHTSLGVTDDSFSFTVSDGTSTLGAATFNIDVTLS